MSRRTHAIASEHNAPEHAARYEVLRHHAMQRHGAMARHGLAVLLGQGVAAWMDAWSKVPAMALRSAKDDSPKPCPLPAGSSAEVVRVLVAMTLGHLQQVHP